MKKLFLIPFVIVLAVGFVFVGCAEPVTPEPGPGPEPQVYHLTMANTHPAADDKNTVIYENWINWLERESNGRLDITFFPGGVLIESGGETYDGARTAVCDIADCVFNRMPDRFPLQEVVMVPLLFGEPASRQTGMTMAALFEKYPELQAEHTEVHVINYHTSAMNHPMFSNKQVKTLEDLKGLIMIELGPWAVKAMAALGGSPTTLPHAETYDAMAKGSVDGMTTNYAALMLRQHIDNVNYITESGSSMDCMMQVMNLDTWNSLPADLQKLFDDSYWTLADAHGYTFDKMTVGLREDAIDVLEGRGLPPPYMLATEDPAEYARWVEAVTPVREEWIANATPIIGEAKAREILADAIAFAEQYKYSTAYAANSEAILHDWGAPGY